MKATATRLPPGLNIDKPQFIEEEYIEESTCLTRWMNQPDQWDREEFLRLTKQHLFKTNGRFDLADSQLVGMLASQIDIYITSIRELKVSGLVVYFNNGVTMGPSPHLTIADKALNRVLQIMKILELSPKARAGRPAPQEISPEIQRFLAGP
jgi:phage terminase small subunit